MPARVTSTAEAHPIAGPSPRPLVAAIDISDQRSRQIKRSDFDDFDLILTADEMVDGRVRRQAPEVSKARIMRMTEPLPDFDKFPEVPDPYYGNAGDYRDVYDLLERSMNELLNSLEEQ